MLRILKTELSYFIVPLLGITLLTLFFTICAAINFQIFINIEFLHKYSWAILLGLGSYAIVFFIWMNRVIEKHEMIISLLPRTNRNKSFNRWIFAVLPFVVLIIYLQFIHFFLNEYWNVHIGRISAQIGFLSMALSAIFITRDLWFVKHEKDDLYKYLIGLLVFFMAAAGAIFIIYIFNYTLVEPLYFYQEELMFLIWGILISSISLISYKNRKNYLE